ncbi:hypothetical protein PR003_g21048 [Phytophthora rubi]|uniref:Secreted protein n=1 Tax=Phytophthora rubi TaxID=129364 RepID=A0A6A3KC56_9STRA|nr:hypothetical protein PR002_g21920 [Phytophthora rubi]KAE9004749.1 hypothetical protein PR001_g17633 [Phytophthora rubi]KAE9307246.1 hypothetical protein PR003_g21048 [Phytophthora rubi]
MCGSLAFIRSLLPWTVQMTLVRTSKSTRPEKTGLPFSSISRRQRWVPKTGPNFRFDGIRPQLLEVERSCNAQCTSLAAFLAGSSCRVHTVGSTARQLRMALLVLR